MTRKRADRSIHAPEDSETPWLKSQRALPRLVVRPLERFLRLETGSAALLMAAAVAALIWANAAGDSYERFWSTTVTVRIGSLRLDEDLRHVVNDLLMAIFFYVIALEVKREMRFGALRDRAAAAVPVAAALGTMVGAAVVYLAINLDGGEPRGWAVPIATDIAFALGVLGLAGRRAPRELRAFLLTLAVVDDLGTIAVIALFYGADPSVAWLGAAAGLTLLVVVLQRLAVRSMVPYVALAGLLWLAVFESGVHPTIAGVVLGFLTPAAAFYARQETGETVGRQLAEIATSRDPEMTEGTLWSASRLSREAVSPLARMEHQLHPWSAYLILPLFALANAGVPVSAGVLADALSGPVGLGIALGLVVGAPIGGFVFAWTLVRSTRARLPDGLDWPAIAGVAPLKGIGFTVAIFISVLAFDDEAQQAEAKLAILIASLLAGVIGLVVLGLRARLLQGRNSS
ncbi:MAG: Na+/H+ antiporter NhaA [Gemmatimonadota bacterium]|nr:Na+/H+ antiporter NhaA [Gemmatimonadota bacterium]